MRYIFIAALTGSALLAAVSGQADEDATARASSVLRDAKDKKIGDAILLETPVGVLLHLTLTNAPPGSHALHIHAVGKCEPPAFESAGGHLNPDDKQHGYFSPSGPHAGDLPNIHVRPNGKLELEVMVPGVRLADGKRALLDADGASLMIHDAPDDYRTDPAGHAGGRIGCGVIGR